MMLTDLQSNVTGGGDHALTCFSVKNDHKVTSFPPGWPLGSSGPVSLKAQFKLCRNAVKSHLPADVRSSAIKSLTQSVKTTCNLPDPAAWASSTTAAGCVKGVLLNGAIWKGAYTTVANTPPCQRFSSATTISGTDQYALGLAAAVQMDRIRSFL